MTIIGNGVVTLASGPAWCEVAPRAGGALAGFWWDDRGSRIDWLRRGAPAAIALGDAEALACFPLVPYAHRIRDARFLFCGREVTLSPAQPAMRHSMHGHGWRRDWTVAECGDDRLVLEYEHAPDAWPWRYRARQSVVLAPEALSLTLEIENLSEELMPAGLGFRPFFPRRSEATLSAAASGVWLTDAEILPTERTAVPPGLDLAGGRCLTELGPDHVFTGWTGRATLDWPERGARLVLEASQPLLSFLAVATPAEGDFFCVGPTSHCSDAINLARAGIADTGLRILAPGARRSVAIALRPELA